MRDVVHIKKDTHIRMHTKQKTHPTNPLDTWIHRHAHINPITLDGIMVLFLLWYCSPKYNHASATLLPTYNLLILSFTLGKMIFHNFHVEARIPFLNYGRFRIPFLKMAWRCWWRLLWEKQRTQNTKSKNLLVASLDCLILSSPLGDIDPFASKIASVALLFYAHNLTSYSFATMIFARFAVALALCASTSAFM